MEWMIIEREKMRMGKWHDDKRVGDYAQEITHNRVIINREHWSESTKYMLVTGIVKTSCFIIIFIVPHAYDIPRFAVVTTLAGPQYTWSDFSELLILKMRQD